MDLFILKILKTPITELSDIEKLELARKCQENGKDEYTTSIIDFNLSDIKYIGLNSLTVTDSEIYDEGNETAILTITEFIDWLNRYGFGTAFGGRGLLGYDIPHIKYEIIKKQLTVEKDISLFNAKKYQNFPIYDLKENLFSWGYSSSILLTLEALKIDYKYYDKNDIQTADDDMKIAYLREYVDNIKKIFIKAKNIL